MNLYNKYRPQQLSDFVGNTSTIKQVESIRVGGSQSFLVTGPVGTGKTSMVRVIANQLAAVVEEVNLSDNNGVDFARDFAEKIQYRGFNDRTVYVLDECHRLTNPAQNIILKVLEEPPSHAYIFLVTTEPEKLLSTVRSRCVPIKMVPPDKKDAIVWLNGIAVKEGIALRNNILESIYTQGGTPRTMLSMLESLRGVETENQSVEGFMSQEEKDIIALPRVLIKNMEWSRIAEVLKRIPQKNPYSIVQVVLGYMRKVMLSDSTHDHSHATIYHRFLEINPDCTFDHIINACSIIHAHVRR